MYKVALITAKKKDPAYIFQQTGVDLGTISLETYLSKKLGRVEFLVSEEIEDVIRFKPDLLGVSTASANYPLAIKIAGEIRDKCGCKAVVGGAHITTCPESLNEVFELGVVGEGEETLREVIELFAGGRAGYEEFDRISSIVYHGNNGPVLTRRRLQIADLGVLPIPDRGKWVDKIGVTYMMTTRGCPYRCFFCAACRAWDGERYFSVDHVIDEVKDVAHGFKPKAIRFFDDVFTNDKNRVREITSRLVKEGLTRDISYICWTRADLIDSEYVDMLKEAGFVHVSFGVESASENLMKKLKGNNFDLKKVQNAIDLLYNAGINVGITFIIGTPGETAKDLYKTQSFIERNADKIFDIEINPILAFPSTPLWEYAKKRGLVGNDMDWEKLSDTGLLINFDFENYIYLNDEFPQKKFMKYVEKFQEIFKEINLRPGNIEFSERTFSASDIPARLKRYP